MDKKQCSSCGAAPHKCSCKNKEFTKAVIEIDDPEQITLMRRVVIPASMGDDTTVSPVVGKYHNVLLYYEANQKSYLYSSDGIPTLLANGLTDYEQAVNLPEINGQTLVGNKTGSDLGLQSELTAGDGIEIDDSTISISDIEQYAHFFDTVADMKAATNLVAGDYARTLGYYTVNDGGGALYKISAIVPSGYYETLASGLYAELIIEELMNVRQFGAKGDGTSDDTSKFQSAITTLASKTIVIPNGTYLLSDSIDLPANIEVKCFGKVEYSADLIYLFQKTSSNDDDYIKFDGIKIEKKDNNFSNLNRFIYVNGGNLEVVNSYFKNYKTAVHHNNGKHLVCKNIILESAYGTEAQAGYGINTSSEYDDVENVEAKNTANTYGRHLIYLNGSVKKHSYINNISVSKWHHNPIQVNVSNTTKPDIIIENCLFNDVCIEADGSNPRRVIGAINVAQDSYGNISIRNIKGYSVPNNLICSVSANTTVNIDDCEIVRATSDSEYATGIYIRYSNGHIINNFINNNSGDANASQAVYIRQSDAIINGIYEIGGYGASMLMSNASTVLLGRYNTTKTPVATTGGGTVAPIPYYSV